MLQFKYKYLKQMLISITISVQKNHHLKLKPMIRCTIYPKNQNFCTQIFFTIEDSIKFVIILKYIIDGGIRFPSDRNP
jgi:hypothetical protein